MTVTLPVRHYVEVLGWILVGQKKKGRELKKET